MSSVTIVCISDTHELHRELDIPAGDLLLHAGDFTMFSRSLKAIEDFNDWLGEHSHLHTIVIPGNHDSFLEAGPRRRNLLKARLPRLLRRSRCALSNSDDSLCRLQPHGSRHSVGIGECEHFGAERPPSLRSCPEDTSSDDARRDKTNAQHRASRILRWSISDRARRPD